MQPRFPKTRTHFLYHNIAGNEDSFGVFFFLLYLETKRLSVKFLFSDHPSMIAVISDT